jgi:hypothetical protein
MINAFKKRGLLATFRGEFSFWLMANSCITILDKVPPGIFHIFPDP